MIVPATDVKNSETLLGVTNSSVKASSSDTFSGGFSEQLKENIAKNNAIKTAKKERLNDNIQKKDEFKSMPKQDSSSASQADSSSGRTDSEKQSERGVENALPGGKSLPDARQADEAGTAIVDQVTEAGELDKPVFGDTGQSGLQALIKTFSEEVSAILDPASDEQAIEPDAGSTLSLAAPLTPAPSTVGFDLKKALPKNVAVDTGQASAQNLHVIGSASGQNISETLAGLGLSFDALQQKSPFDLLHGPLKSSIPTSVSSLFNLNQSLLPQNDVVLPQTSTMSRIESTSAYASPLMSPLSDLAANISDKLTLERPITHSRWSQDLGERVQWMMNRSMNGAEIRLNPPQLGPMEVRIQMNQDQASIAFASQHANVREALEAALPRLREMLSQQSLNLVNVDISQHSFSDQRQQGQMGEGSSARTHWPVGSDSDLMPEDGVSPMAGPVYEGLINTYV